MQDYIRIAPDWFAKIYAKDLIQKGKWVRVIIWLERNTVENAKFTYIMTMYFVHVVDLN
jgi:hypothetical protein